MKIAIVGAGISGLTAAHELHRRHDVTVFEAGSYAGGHTNTIDVDDPIAGHLRIDTGFIVLNDRTYPNFNALLDELGVARQDTHMGFSVTADFEDFEYAGTPPRRVLPGAQPRAPALSPHDRRPRAVQPQPVGPAGQRRARSVAARVPRRGRLQRLVRRPPHRPAGVRRLVGRP
ncbi:FAD-dependent oxidoreductase [Svornostia abyssi]|uniref:FAD-dependent oxidoreductase n=1 Tax=Svornostia abyssi TaxID=2898438 RepID=A0ABY5PEK4_9ACTN|nr:FAD-dependent oxidoreductase [Parviterribacteraceae bacterium J379]